MLICDSQLEGSASVFPLCRFYFSVLTSPLNGEGITAASLKPFHLSTLSPSNISVFLPSGKIKYLVLPSEIHSKVLSQFHNPNRSVSSKVIYFTSDQRLLFPLTEDKDKLQWVSWYMHWNTHRINTHMNRYVSMVAHYTSVCISYSTKTTLLTVFSLLLLFFFSPFLHRCAWTGMLRFNPSMPLARQHHRATVPTAGWVLALALFLALQVKMVRYKFALSTFLSKASHGFFFLPLIYYLFLIYYFSQPC